MGEEPQYQRGIEPPAGRGSSVAPLKRNVSSSQETSAPDHSRRMISTFFSSSSARGTPPRPTVSNSRSVLPVPTPRTSRGPYRLVSVDAISAVCTGWRKGTSAPVPSWTRRVTAPTAASTVKASKNVALPDSKAAGLGNRWSRTHSESKPRASARRAPSSRRSASACSPKWGRTSPSRIELTAS